MADKSNKKDKPDKAATWIFIFFIIFYAIQIPLSYLFDTPVQDYIILSIIIIILFLLHLKFHFNRLAAFFMCFAFIFHALGMYHIIPTSNGYLATLYGAPQLDYHYDTGVHILCSLFGTLAAFLLVYGYMKSGLKSTLMATLIIILAIIGIGSVMEVIEYAGFQNFGFGDGFFLLGMGDYAKGESTWDNSCTDMLGNIIGAVAGASIYLAFLNKEQREQSRTLIRQ